MDCTFTPGQHVVCVDDSRWDRTLVNGLPIRGVVYTVRSLYFDGGLRCVETRATPARPDVPVCRAPCCDGEYWLQPDCFRPLPRLRVEDFTGVREPALSD